MNIDEQIKELEKQLLMALEISKEYVELKKIEQFNSIKKVECGEKHSGDYFKTEEQTEQVRWRADKYGKYYYLNDVGRVFSAIDEYNNVDNFRYYSGNYFKTENKTERYELNLLTYQQLKDIALRLNNGQEINWNNRNQNKYYFYFDFRGNRFVTDIFITDKDLLTVYCLDKNFLNVALDEIGETSLKQLLVEGI